MVGARSVTAWTARAATVVVVSSLAVSVATGLAGAAAKNVTVARGITVTVPRGWSAGKPTAGRLQVTHKSPNAVVAISTGEVAGSASQNGTRLFDSFVQGFGLTHVEVSSPRQAPLSGARTFNQASSLTYTARYQGQTLGGIAIEFQNSVTGVEAFAVVIAKQRDNTKLKKAVNAMVTSLAQG